MNLQFSGFYLFNYSLNFAINKRSFAFVVLLWLARFTVDFAKFSLHSDCCLYRCGIQFPFIPSHSYDLFKNENKVSDQSEIKLKNPNNGNEAT